MLPIYDQVIILKRAHQLALVVYRLSAQLPANEQYGLVSQIRKSAVSVAANIAEGLGRESIKETIQFLSISRGSAMETAEHMLLIRDLGLVNAGRADVLISDYRGLSAGITAFIKARKQRIQRKKLPQ